MDKELNGTTHDTGAEVVKEEQAFDQGQKEEISNSTQGDGVKSVPYERFQRLNAQKKAAEEQLQKACDAMAQKLPKNLYSLVPSGLPLIERMQWITNAYAMATNETAPPSSPDPSRPQPKPDFDINNASPHSLMSAGYK